MKKFKPGDYVDYKHGQLTTTGHRVLPEPKDINMQSGDALITGVEGIVKESDLTYTKGVRRPLPVERKGLIHKFTIDKHDIYLRTGEYEDGRLGELFITVAKEGDAWRAYDNMAIAMSIALQYSIPGILKAFIDKFEHTQLMPAGVVGKISTEGVNRDAPVEGPIEDNERIAKSIGHYIAIWLRRTYLSREILN